MTKRRTKFIIIAVIIIAALSAAIVYPSPFNTSISFFNTTFHLNIPRIPENPFHLGLDLQGGAHLIYQADLSKIGPESYESVMGGLRDVIERRVNLFGVQEPLVQIEKTGKNYQLIVELAGIKDSAEAIRMIGETPFLEFREEKTSPETQVILDKQKEVEGKTMEEIQGIADWYLALEDPYYKSTELTGKYLEKTELGFDQTTNAPLILLQFNADGSRIFEELTGKNTGKSIAIYLDGVLLSAPRVTESISGGKAQITGQFSIQEARTLVRNLNAGALPVPISLISQQSVGPTLGSSSLQASLQAGVYGLIGVIVFMILFYRFPGLISAVALALYILVILALFKLIPVTLTLAGIGGFILSIGIAVDANVLIFSRMKEEFKEGKPFSLALEEGFRRSWPAIRDGNFTTLIVAVILFVFGTSFVKGFAFTLSLGVIVSMLSAIVVTRSLLRLFTGTFIERWNFIWGIPKINKEKS